ncbi:hypothetical protein HID58_034108 [Brassica napus]|uniref:Uncharacterized protein n=1 Tax=Brassica napus TaxID=3708 RepID=A0ABQ8C136_BRANA|nr:hypothetical protein HID58_034108 [Brassica napus]
MAVNLSHPREANVPGTRGDRSTRDKNYSKPVKLGQDERRKLKTSRIVSVILQLARERLWRDVRLQTSKTGETKNRTKNLILKELENSPIREGVKIGRSSTNSFCFRPNWRNPVASIAFNSFPFTRSGLDQSMSFGRFRLDLRVCIVGLSTPFC